MSPSLSSVAQTHLVLAEESGPVPLGAYLVFPAAYTDFPPRSRDWACILYPFCSGLPWLQHRKFESARFSFVSAANLGAQVCSGVSVSSLSQCTPLPPLGFSLGSCTLSRACLPKAFCVTIILGLCCRAGSVCFVSPHWAPRCGIYSTLSHRKGQWICVNNKRKNRSQVWKRKEGPVPGRSSGALPGGRGEKRGEKGGHTLHHTQGCSSLEISSGALTSADLKFRSFYLNLEKCCFHFCCVCGKWARWLKLISHNFALLSYRLGLLIFVLDITHSLW